MPASPQMDRVTVKSGEVEDENVRRMWFSSEKGNLGSMEDIYTIDCGLMAKVNIFLTEFLEWI